MPEHAKPDFQIHDDGSKVKDSVKAAVIQITVDERVDQASVCTIELRDEGAMLSDGKKFKIGSDLKVELGYVGATKAVFEGEITGWRGAFPRRGPQQLTVIALDRFHRMRRTRKRRSFLKMKDSEIAEQVAGDYGFSTDTKATPVKHDYVLQANQSDADFLLERAALFGYELYIDGAKKLVFRAPKLDAGPVATLKWHQSLKHFAPTISVARTHAQVKATGFDMKQKKAVLATAKKGDESSLMGGSKPGSELEAKISADPDQNPFMPMLSPDEADALAKGLLDRSALKLVTGDGSAWGSNLIRRGTIIQIDDIGQFLSGHYYVATAVHTLVPGKGYTTTFHVKRTAVQKPPETLTAHKKEPQKKPPEKEPEPKDVVFLVSDETGKKLEGLPYILRKPDGSTKPGKLGKDGKVEEKKVPAGTFVLELESVSDPNVPGRIESGKPVKISADVTGLAPGSKVEFQVFEPFGLGGDPIQKVSGATSEKNPHRVEVEWTYDHKAHERKVHGSTLLIVAKAGETAVSISKLIEVVEKLETTVKDAGGKVLADRDIVLRSQRGPNFDAKTDKEGKLTTLVPPGDYRLEVIEPPEKLPVKKIVLAAAPPPAAWVPFKKAPPPPGVYPEIIESFWEADKPKPATAAPFAEAKDDKDSVDAINVHTPKIKKGDENETVRIFQFLLNEKLKRSWRVAVTAKLDDQTIKGMKRFQKANALKETDEPNDETWAKLEDGPAPLGAIHMCQLAVGAARYKAGKHDKDLGLDEGELWVHKFPNTKYSAEKPDKTGDDAVDGLEGKSGVPILYITKMDCDADGTPRATRDALGGKAWDGSWQPDTSLRFEDNSSINAIDFPYFALSTEVVSAYGIAKGDVAAIIYKGRVAYAVYGDSSGSTRRTGESSIKVHLDLGRGDLVRTKPDSMGIDYSEVIHIVFPGSSFAIDVNKKPGHAPDMRLPATLTADDVAKRGAALLEMVGGKPS
ncbi:hypothetical protein HY251_19010 [bacterium]|nr:hypothetical protein [bacterium]